ncbi:hypothetical protein PXK30_16850 [Phaeobacter gallaeciensis]|jgi:hypothetical protein|uniref:hypothetical protein n=1 Tax=Phaeobacter gallaeciensis TaxID=60890 RepID=UPI00237F294F|nr:hypothetical protein [Phaeobacter gallaeciensis]MDE4276062.1 hypothetical protein [Phaeobacter gallaeciensis]MDE4301291.1 hypothetical protein [Phaeobacter gallaeciensis]MDE4305198.1 hypothetical protein [Phaeobacter gallaeciensis]MDE4309546.1 hypothetical protein [Phaeobacter gallaeciensis]MDE4314131.1 hypothetical protein [Phaeobacter gallaeciensis]
MKASEKSLRCTSPSLQTYAKLATVAREWDSLSAILPTVRLRGRRQVGGFGIFYWYPEFE